MGLFPQQFIDDLRLQANIVSVVQEYVPLRRVGTKYKGLCPFHSEKTPSFHVDPEKGFFHCFGCHAGGDVFKFLELHEKVGFQDAVRMLAQKFGIPLPERSVDSEDDDTSRRDAKLREELLKIHEVAAAFFREQLQGAAGVRAREQLKERSVSAQTVEQLGFGFAPPGRDALKASLLKQGYSTGLLVQSGLVFQKDDGDVVDRFRNRLMVPICRETGSVIGFGGRAMAADQQPKYLNSPETPIYSKGRTLYGLNLTKTAIRKLGFAVMVEGYFDFAQVYQSQAAPVVASCGTALTANQAHLLRRFTNKVVLSYDPDAAGQGAAARSCELLVAEGFDVNVVVLDKGEDPDTFIRKKGADRYRERLRTSRPYLEYLMDRAALKLDVRSPESQRAFLNEMLQVAGRLPEAAARDQFGDKIAHKAKIAEDVVRAEIRKAAVARKPFNGPVELTGLGQIKDAERALIWWLVNSPDEVCRAISAIEDEDLEHLVTKEVFQVARDLQNQPAELLPSSLLQRLSTVNGQLVTRIASSSEPPALVVAACVDALQRLRLDRERAAIQREIVRLQENTSENHDREIAALWEKKKELLHRIESLEDRPVLDTRERHGASASASGGGAPRGLMNVD